MTSKEPVNPYKNMSQDDFDRILEDIIADADVIYNRLRFLNSGVLL
tara:strand:+ start:580 stop:717 length:138 start_codon:yes stop_codon:yes gene_type:complete